MMKRGMAAVAAVLLLSSCQYLQDRVRQGRRLRIDLVNVSQAAEPVNIAPEHEPYAEANLLGGGASRRIELVVERGDAKRFRAGRGQVTLDILSCVVTHATNDVEEFVAKVVWERDERLRCENW